MTVESPIEETCEFGAFKDQKKDPGFLVARGNFRGTDGERESEEKQHRTKLSNAIFMAINKHGYATIRAVGTYAIANAVRSITVASDRCRVKGIALSWESVVERGNLGPLRKKSHVEDVVAYCFRLTSWKEMEKEQENV